MKRKMVWIGTGWLLGLLLAAISQTPWTVYLLLAAWMLLGAFRLFRRLKTGQMLCFGVALTLAVGASLGYTALYYQPAMEQDGRYTTFSGHVTSVTTYDNDRAMYQVKGIFRDGTRAKLLVYTDDVGARYGDTLHVAGPFQALEDTYLWNTASFYRSKGIFLEAGDDAYVTCTPTERGKLVRTLDAYRSWISDRICTYAGEDAGGMVNAMLLGTSETLQDEDEAVFAYSGISHILSVSGLHLVLLLGVWIVVAKRLHRYVRFGGTVLWIVLYTLLVGTPVPMLRAGLMFLLLESSLLCFRRSDTVNSLCIAGLLLTIPNPYLILNASFALSMAGTFGLGVFAPWMIQKLRWRTLAHRLRNNFVAMLCVSLCVFPVTICYFRDVSLISPVANVLLVPIASLMLLLSLPIFLTGGVAFVARPLCLVLHLLYDVLMLLSRGLRRLVPVMFPAGWKLLPLLCVILVGFVGTVWLVKRTPRATALALAVSFGLLAAGSALERYGQSRQFQVAVLGDKRQAVVVITHQDRTDVIDLTGNHRNPSYVDAYLDERGIRQVNSLCLTKRSAQMQVDYAKTLDGIQADEMVLPTQSSVWTTAQGETSVQQADAFTLQDTLYTVAYEDGGLAITYGALRFYVGTSVAALPTGDWDCAIVTAWKGEGDAGDTALYQKEAPVRLCVASSGTWALEVLE